jgi:hypothetical protein
MKTLTNIHVEFGFFKSPKMMLPFGPGTKAAGVPEFKWLAYG